MKAFLRRAADKILVWFEHIFGLSHERDERASFFSDARFLGNPKLAPAGHGHATVVRIVRVRRRRRRRVIVA